MEQYHTDAEKQATLQYNMNNVNMGRKVFQDVMEETKRPMELQKQFLTTILDENKDTEYGRLHSFGDIHGIEDFQKRVPVSTWADFEPYIERMKNGEKNVLTAYGFDHMNMTSGTSGKSKYIPYTDKHRDTFAKYNSFYTQGLIAQFAGSDWCSGRTYCPSTGHLDTLESGITVGHVGKKIAEYLGGADKADKVMRTAFTSPIEASEAIPGMDDKYAHCRFFLEDRDVTGINVMYFPFLISQFKYMTENIDLLIHDIETGTIDESVKLTDECRESLTKKIRPLPERAAELREIFKNGTDFPFVPKVWPNMKYITGCSGGGFTTYDRIVRQQYTGEDLIRFYYGITATEGLFSVAFKPDSIESVLTPGSLFMEFLPVDAEDDFSQIVTMDKLEVGKTYELVITNAAGLYRYRMSDSVHVTG